METKAREGSRVSVRTTLVAVLGPALETVMK
jgi:hypothetical protein